MTLALIAALPFLGALLPGLLAPAGRRVIALSVGTTTALAFALLVALAPQVLHGTPVSFRTEWVPMIGLNANFFLDGLGLLFAGLILGIGLLIILYACFYLAPHEASAQFYTYLMLFQGAMVGIVLSDNVLMLLVFWELTSLSSFLLIGFWKHLPEGRRGARMALAITGMGGLAMIAGLLILGRIAGSFDLTEILSAKEAIQASDWYLPALLLILIGAFTKSAQFPFHFWLPQAMAAPTPVSAYLHSATMVKAGLFLLARLWPVLSGTPEWFYIVATTGLLTVLIGAKTAFFKDDMKALLAYSTVSHLGLITMLLGFGTPSAASVAVFHILNHATFKAALFMVAGIVDHEAHTRSISRLGGLRRLMPLTFAIATVASLSMAGLPPLNGFLSKELMLEEASHTVWAGLPWLIPLLALAGALVSVAYSFRFLAQGFLGPVRSDYPHRPHDPGPGLWLPPAALAALVVAIGLAPMPLAAWLVDAAAGAVTAQPVHMHLALWHGLAPASLWMSLAAIGGGLVMLGVYRPLLQLWTSTPRPDGPRLFELTLQGAIAAARPVAALHDGSMARSFAVALVAMLAAPLWALYGSGPALLTRDLTPAGAVPILGWALLVASLALLLRWQRDRLLLLVQLGVIGVVISVAFAYLSATDLALTQITVEVVTVILLLLALNFLPRTSAALSRGRAWRDGLIALAVGTAVAALSLVMMLQSPAFEPISAFHLANAKTGGGGTNAVNVIIVDFRGFDTFGEIVVLGLAAVIIHALTEVLLAPGRANDRLLAMIPQRDAGDRHPMMMAVAMRLILPIAVLVAVFFFLRGHNLPGGGFVAGLIVSIALILQYIGSGFAWSEARLRIGYAPLIGGGVLVAAATGLGALPFGRPFLTSTHGYVTLPPLEKFELASAALFDLGVFLTVLGAIMLALASLSRIAMRAGTPVNRRPFGIDPSGGR